MKKYTIILIILFILGFLISLFPIRTGFHYWDEAVYLQHAEIIGGFREDNYSEFQNRPILISFLIALGYKIHHSIITAHVIVSFVSSLGIIFVFILAKKLYKNEKIALLSSIIFLLNPLNINLAHDILIDAMLPSLWVMTIFFGYLAAKNKKVIHYILTGIFFALSILLKFTSLSLFFLIVIIFFIFKKNNLKKFLFDKKGLYMILSFLLTMLPYFIFAQKRFFFLYPIINNYFIVNWDTPTVWHFFFTHFFELFPFIFCIGIFFFIYFIIKGKIGKEDLMLILIIVVPFLLTLHLQHKEMRFLLPIVPFLAIMASRGFYYFFSIMNKKGKYFGSIVLFLIITYPTISLFSNPPAKYILNQRFFIYDEPAIMEASLWLKDNAPEDAIIYNNFQYPVLGYYSEKNVSVLPRSGNFQSRIDAVMEKPGYLVFPSDSPAYREPKLDFLMNDSRFTLIKKFEKEGQVAYIFKYK